MPSRALVQLDSYQLAQYVVQVPCYVCEGGNTFDAELCRHCCAPMALAHQANAQGVRPTMMAVLGAAGAGKTVYLGTLMDLLSRRTDHLQLLARGAFSITLQQMTLSALARCEFPPRTPLEADRWHWAYCQLRPRKRAKPIDFILPDAAGRAIEREIEHPMSYDGLASLLRKSQAALLLVDAAQLADGDPEPDFTAARLLSRYYQDDLAIRQPPQKRGLWKKAGRKQCERPVAVIFTKTDEAAECPENPRQFAERYTPRLAQLCRENLRRHEFFAASIAGSCATRRGWAGEPIRFPTRIEPRGVVEPFEWLIGQI